MGGKPSRHKPRKFLANLKTRIYDKSPTLPSFEQFKNFLEDTPSNIKITDALGHNLFDLVMFSYKKMMVSNRKAGTWNENSFHHHRDMLDLLFQYNAQVDGHFGDEKLTPLHEAVEAGDPDLVRILLKQDLVNPNALTKKGESPLHFAAFAETPKQLKERYSSMFTPSRRCPMINMLCEAGANTNIKNSDGMSAIHVAASLASTKETEERVLALLGCGANPKILTDPVGNRGQMTASDFAERGAKNIDFSRRLKKMADEYDRVH